VEKRCPSLFHLGSFTVDEFTTDAYRRERVF
jgi:hypothetical protein